jgi:hypothetical protein
MQLESSPSCTTCVPLHFLTLATRCGRIIRGTYRLRMADASVGFCVFRTTGAAGVVQALRVLKQHSTSFE